MFQNNMNFNMNNNNINNVHVQNLLSINSHLTSIQLHFNSLLTQIQNIGLLPFLNTEIINLSFQILNCGIQMLSLIKQIDNDSITNIPNSKEQINGIINQLNNFLNHSYNNINQNNNMNNNNLILNEDIRNYINNDLKSDIKGLKDDIKMIKEQQEKDREIKTISSSPIVNVCMKNKFEDSKIISVNEYDMISDWISPNKKIEVNLLYRASKDGDKASDFHNRCDNKGSTFCIFYLENGYKIGGYTSISWQNNRENKKDPNAFICSITNKEKYELKNKNGNAVYHGDSVGPEFYDGNGYADILIYDNCLQTNNGIQVFINAYNSSMKKLIGQDSNTYQLLKMKDYEVYQVL